jgi:hypothetical protein
MVSNSETLGLKFKDANSEPNFADFWAFIFYGLYIFSQMCSCFFNRESSVAFGHLQCMSSFLVLCFHTFSYISALVEGNLLYIVMYVV